MNCNVVKDLIPLYIDRCCSEESQKAVEEHIHICNSCRKLLEDMKSPSDIVTVPNAPQPFRKLNQWKASVLQSVMLFLSFALITIGVTLEARTPLSIGNGFWALNLIIPATGLMLSLANWYFVKVYRSRKIFSNCSLIATVAITFCGYIWSAIHYGANLFPETDFMGILSIFVRQNGIGLLLAAAFCALSKVLSNQYAKILGKA